MYFWTRGEFSARTPTFREELLNFTLFYLLCLKQCSDPYSFDTDPDPAL